MSAPAPAMRQSERCRGESMASAGAPRATVRPVAGERLNAEYVCVPSLVSPRYQPSLERALASRSRSEAGCPRNCCSFLVRAMMTRCRSRIVPIQSDGNRCSSSTSRSSEVGTMPASTYRTAPPRTTGTRIAMSRAPPSPPNDSLVEGRRAAATCGTSPISAVRSGSRVPSGRRRSSSVAPEGLVSTRLVHSRCIARSAAACS